MQAWRCSRPYKRKPTAARRSSRSRLDRKLLWSSASTLFPLGPLQPFRRTTADWHSNQSASFFMPPLSWLARAFRPQRLRCSMSAAMRALGRCTGRKHYCVLRNQNAWLTEANNKIFNLKALITGKYKILWENGIVINLQSIITFRFFFRWPVEILWKRGFLRHFSFFFIVFLSAGLSPVKLIYISLAR